MDWTYLFPPSALQIALGFIIAKLFELLSERRQDKRLRAQLDAEKERLQIQHRDELRKRLFDSKFETALRITRLLRASAQTLHTQMLLHAASYAEGKIDVQMFRELRDTTFDRIQGAINEGYDAAAVMELLFKDLSFGDLPHQAPLVSLNAKWRGFLQLQQQLLEWLDSQKASLPPMLPTNEIAARNAEVSQRMQQMRDQTAELFKLSVEYDEAVSKSIRILSEAIEP